MASWDPRLHAAGATELPPGDGFLLGDSGYRQSLHSAMEGTVLRKSLIVPSANAVISAEPEDAKPKDAEHPPPATRVTPALQSLVLWRRNAALLVFVET